MHNTNHLIASLHCHVTNTHIGKLKTGKTDSTGDPTKSTTHSSRAGLQFPVGHVHCLLKKGNYPQCVGAGALASILFHYCIILFNKFHFCSVYLAAVPKYLAAEILKLTSNAAHDNKKHHIIPCHLQLAYGSCSVPSPMLALFVIGWINCLMGHHYQEFKMFTT